MAKVLVVDDERSIRWTLGEFLRNAGYEVAEAEDADAAMKLLHGAAFDVVVTDVVLPRVTGVELLRMIHEVSPEVMVVMMTGEPTVETAAEAVRLGAVDYLPKPVDKTSILRVVANAARIKILEDSRKRLEEENRAHRENLEKLVAERTEELRASQARFLRAQRIESIGSLASGIAHDLNNILAPIMLLMDYLKSQNLGLAEPGEADPIHLIDTSTRRAVGIVNQLLVFGRGQEGAKRPIQLRHLLVEMTRIIKETFPRSIEVSASWPEDLWLIPANSTQIHQVLLNLCVNARDAMPQGGKLRIIAENMLLDAQQLSQANLALEPGTYVRLQVCDTGCGIPAEIRDRIFDSFFTTKAEGAGTGLGLTTVLGIVKEHHGFLSFTSELGQGTTFVVHLPAIRQQETEMMETATVAIAPRGQGEWVLVVDDEEVLCKATCMALRHHGYHVITAKDGIEALALFAKNPGKIRVMITDVMMPRMDGIVLCSVVSELSPLTKVVVSSGGLFGKEGEKTVQALKRVGVQQILHKPHDSDVLLQAIAAELKHTQGAS